MEREAFLLFFFFFVLGVSYCVCGCWWRRWGDPPPPSSRIASIETPPSALLLHFPEIFFLWARPTRCVAVAAPYMADQSFKSRTQWTHLKSISDATIPPPNAPCVIWLYNGWKKKRERSERGASVFQSHTRTRTICQFLPSDEYRKRMCPAEEVKQIESQRKFKRYIYIYFFSSFFYDPSSRRRRSFWCWMEEKKMLLVVVSARM